MPWGLAWLLAQLEAGIGKEEQELQKHYFENFIFKTHRPKGMSGAEFVQIYENSLQDAIDHGAVINNVLRSHLLVRTASLS